MKTKKFDFGGWATRNNLKCSDGRTILKDAFKDNDGQTVPLVWNHQHNGPDNVLGHALLENRKDGVYAYCTFNDTEQGQISKILVQHGDISALSIFANQIRERASNVLHGAIKEVSLVLAGANPGAFIDTVALSHGDDADGEAIIYTGEPISLCHSGTKKEDEDGAADDPDDKDEDKNPDKKDDGDEETIEDVINTFNEKQKNVFHAVVGEIMARNGVLNDEEKGGSENMKHNVFDNDQQVQANVLSHADQAEILKLAKSEGVGSFKAAMKIYMEENNLQHSDISGFVQTGNGNVATLFPEYVEAHPSRTPELITNDMGWVDAIMAKTQKIPHGRIDALVRRTTDPQTVYVTSELHRDDVVDIEDFDYVQFQYGIDQISLKETLAVATMLGDNRPDSDPEKIFPEHIRPVWVDDELYTIHKDIDFAAMAKELQGNNAADYFGESFIYAEAMVTALRMARKGFRGTGKPDLYITTDMHNTMILARDRNGRRIYETDTELAAALGVANIYEVTQFEDKIRTDADNKKHKLLAICVNMADYGYGASKGGDVTHFTDFDIKFNKLQSLLETRKSGQLTRIKSAIVIEELIEEQG